MIKFNQYQWNLIKKTNKRIKAYKITNYTQSLIHFYLVCFGNCIKNWSD